MAIEKGTVLVFKQLKKEFKLDFAIYIYVDVIEFVSVVDIIE